jgi:methylated-DNA-[protein]-cysteine S-methyltransferase
MNTPLAAQCRTPSPLGDITLAATEQGLAGAWFDAQKHHPGPLLAAHQPQHRWLVQAAQELQAYFQNQLRQFTVPLDPQGTVFQQRVWQSLLRIPHGGLCSYGALAQQLGQPSAARAVGAAVGRNPLSIIVPCHRVLGQNGSLTGYAGGLQRKQALLTLEGALAQSSLGLGVGASTAAARHASPNAARPKPNTGNRDADNGGAAQP